MNFLAANRNYRCLIFVSALYTAFDILCPFFLNKFVKLPFGIVDATIFISVFGFMFSDVIAEIYGYHVAIKILWMSTLSKIIFGLFFRVIMSLPSPYNPFQKSAFLFVSGHIISLTIITTLLYFIAYPLNAYLLVKWKFLLRGKYFCLRSLCSTGIAEIIFALLLAPFWMIFNIGNNEVILELVTTICIIKIIFNVLLSFPCMIIVKILRIIEGERVLNNHDFANPFYMKWKERAN